MKLNEWDDVIRQAVIDKAFHAEDMTLEGVMEIINAVDATEMIRERVMHVVYLICDEVIDDVLLADVLARALRAVRYRIKRNK